jgi:hypothetical protein
LSSFSNKKFCRKTLLMVEAALLPRNFSSQFFIFLHGKFYTVNVRTFAIRFYFGSGSKSGMHSGSGSGSAKAKSSVSCGSRSTYMLRRLNMFFNNYA